MEAVVPTEPLAGLGREGRALLMATRCSGAAAATSLQEGGVTRGRGKFGFLWAEARKSATLSISSGPPRPRNSGHLQREESRAATRRFSPPSATLQIIYVALCKLTLLLHPDAAWRQVLMVSARPCEDRRAARGSNVARSLSKEKALPARSRERPSPSSALPDVLPARWWGWALLLRLQDPMEDKLVDGGHCLPPL